MRTLAALCLGLMVGACASTRHLNEPGYALDIPEHWDVTRTRANDAIVLRLVAGQYGGAVIDEGAGSAPGMHTYDEVTADVEIRVYLWSAAGDATAIAGETHSAAVNRRLAADAELQLPAHFVVADHPLECSHFPRDFTQGGKKLDAINLVRRPGWRTIVLGLRQAERLLGVVARVPFEQDRPHYCRNLRNLQVQVQTFLDGMTLRSARPGAGERSGNGRHEHALVLFPRPGFM